METPGRVYCFGNSFVRIKPGSGSDPINGARRVLDYTGAYGLRLRVRVSGFRA